jgi:hypothetical protein
MIRKLAALLAGAGAALTVLPASASAAAEPAASTPTRSVVALEPDFHRHAPPDATLWMDLEPRLQILVGPALWARSIRWTHWSSRSARGVGYLVGADEGTTRLGRVVITLWRPRWSNYVARNGGWRYFTRMHTTRSTGRRYHQPATTWRWSWSCGEWASTRCSA